MLILGLDGIDPFLIEEYSEELPNLSELMDRDSTGLLESVLPPVTRPAWGCSFTGKLPETLGRFDMKVLNKDFEYSFEHLPSEEIMNQGFWEFTDARVGLMDVPSTAVSKVNGWVLGGPFNVSEEDAYPEDLSEELRENLGEFEWDLSGTGEEKRRKAFEQFEMRKKTLNYFLESKDADVYFYVFRVTDTLMHHCSEEDQLIEAYRRADKYLGELMDRDLDIMVVSDHGAVKADKSYSLNTWLIEKDFLEMEESSETDPSFLRRFALKVGEKALNLGFKDQLSWLNSKYEELFGEQFRTTGKIDLDSVSWGDTEAFSYTVATCRYAGVWINDDRFPQGAVEYRQKKKEDLKKEIEAIDEVEEVMLKEEAFQKDHRLFPDLVVKYSQHVKQDSAVRSEPVSDIYTYMHRKEGLIGLHGGAFDGVPEGAELIDIAPTVLHYLGEDIPEEMDGKVLDIFAEGTQPAEREPERFSEEVSNIDF
jgi:predicted AlkP superfamily phosphohydrolase/phosphomutase